MLRTIFEVTVAIFAVFGIYCAFRALAELCFVPRAYAVSVRLRPGEPVGELADRIVEARLALCGAAEPRVLLLCDEYLLPDDETLALLHAHAGDVLLVTPYFAPNKNET